MRVFPIFAATMTPLFRAPTGGGTGGRLRASGRSIPVHSRARSAASPPVPRGTAALSSTSALGQGDPNGLGHQRGRLSQGSPNRPYCSGWWYHSREQPLVPLHLLRFCFFGPSIAVPAGATTGGLASWKRTRRICEKEAPSL